MNDQDDDKEDDWKDGGGQSAEESAHSDEQVTSQADEEGTNSQGPMTLQNELEVTDLGRVMFFKDNKIFSAVGPTLPIVQLDKDGAFVTHAPDQPYREEVDEDLTVHSDEHGRLLDSLGEVRKLSGMKYHGHQLFYIKERHPENGQNLVAWFDDNWKPHRLYLDTHLLSGQMIIKVRDRMLDGEISAFPEIQSE